MVTTAIFNGALALGVLAMVIAPLVWAIRTQHRDHSRPAVTERATATAGAPRPQPRRHAPQPSYQPVVGRA